MVIHLVHGAWHGRWCWKNIIGELERHGHTVVARDLPGLGEDKTPMEEVTLERYTDAVCEALLAEPKPVLLVGHSMAGIVISQAAERHPDRIKGLVYVTAYLLSDGQALLQVAQEDEQMARLAPWLIVDGPICNFQADKHGEVFYNCCTESDAEWASSMLVPQPLAPWVTPIHVTNERFGSVPRFYVKCRQDHALVPSLQERMLAATSCQTVVSIDTDHSPFLSTPSELVSHLLSFCT
jgi:pimeloyl-ACP methyl ester carboxylesterase